MVWRRPGCGRWERGARAHGAFARGFFFPDGALEVGFEREPPTLSFSPRRDGGSVGERRCCGFRCRCAWFSCFCAGASERYLMLGCFACGVFFFALLAAVPLFWAGWVFSGWCLWLLGSSCEGLLRLNEDERFFLCFGACDGLGWTSEWWSVRCIRRLFLFILAVRCFCWFVDRCLPFSGRESRAFMYDLFAFRLRGTAAFACLRKLSPRDLLH